MANVKRHPFLTEAIHSYTGPVTDQGHRTGYGCEKYDCSEYNYQEYCGQFLHNNFHGEGSYFIEKDTRTFIYGPFYCNKLEGYGQVVYNDGSSFEGLFKKHVRFGPGVRTYSNQTQDVGLWKGFQLMRLCTSLRGLVPKLIESTSRGAKLLKYRTVVPVCETPVDKAQQILDELGIEDGLVDPKMLYNLDIQEPTSSFFNKAEYDNISDCTIDVEDEAVSLHTIEEYLMQESRNIELNEEKIEQLVSQIHMAENKLEILRAKRNAIADKVNYCEMCCREAVSDSKMEDEETQEVEDVTVSRETVTEEVVADPSESKVEVNYFLNYSSRLSECELNQVDYENNTSSHAEESQSAIKLIKSSTGSVRTLQDIVSLGSVTSLEHKFDTYCQEEEQKVGDEKEEEEKEEKEKEEEKEEGKEEEVEENEKEEPEEREEEQENEIHGEFEEDLVEEPEKETSFQHECICDALCLDNIDYLKKTMEEIDEESAFYTTTLTILTVKLRREFAPPRPKQTRTVAVTDLLAWNNEEMSIEFLKHSFRHHRNESNVTFNVKLLLKGDRESFREAGEYEINCMSFLRACAHGMNRKVFQLIRDADINPDICDSHGNGGVMYAAVNDCTDVIRSLAKFGAKLDLINDEGLTPLTLLLLQYLTYKMKVNCWEKGFLPETKIESQELGLIQAWRPHQSLVSVSNTNYEVITASLHEASSSRRSMVLSQGFSFLDVILRSTDKVKQKSQSHLEMIALKTIDDTKEQNYIFEWDYKRAPIAKKAAKSKKKKGGKKSGKSSKKSTSKKASSKKSGKSNKTSEAETSGTVPNQDEDNKKRASIDAKLEMTKRTILTLLFYHSDPNIGRVPHPALVLAIFTKNLELFGALLDHGAYPDAITDEQNLTCLHVLTSLSPCEEHLQMIKELLSHKANPNLKTNDQHWPHLREELLGNAIGIDIEETEQKNPLHILCLREDYENDFDDFFGLAANALIQYGCSTDDLYLGHTPLSLAILRNNIKLVAYILSTKVVNPYRVLGNGMGNVLTILILKRFIFDEKAAKGFIDRLIHLKVNPLMPIGQYPNVIHFIENEFRPPEKKEKKDKKLGKDKKSKDKKSKDKKSKDKKSKGKSSKSKSSKKTKRSKRDYRIAVAKYLTEMTRHVLFRHIQGGAVRYLYNFMTERLYSDPLIGNLAQFVTPEEALNIIKLMFFYQKLSLSELSYEAVENMLNYVSKCHDHLYNVEDMIANLRSSSIGKIEWKSSDVYDLHSPEIDNVDEIYQVCFHCLKRFEKLLLCPGCELVHFCSEHCRNLNQELYPAKHKCNMELVKVEDAKNRLDYLVQLVQNIRETKLIELELEAMEKLIQRRKHPSKANMMKLEELKDKLRQAREDIFFSETSQSVESMSDQIQNEASLEIVHGQEQSQILAPGRRRSQIMRQSLISSTFSKSITSPSATDVIAKQFNIESSPINPDERKSKMSQKSKTTSLLVDHLSTYNIDNPDVNEEQKRVRVGNKEQSRGSREVVAGDGMRKQKVMQYISFDNFGPVRLVRELLDEGARQDEEASRRLLPASHYINLLSKAFEGFNLPLSLLPYVCLKDGQLFYSMENSPHFSQFFHQLKLS